MNTSDYAAPSQQPDDESLSTPTSLGSAASAWAVPVPDVVIQPQTSDVSTDFSQPEHWPEIPGYVIQEHLGEGGFGSVYRAHSIRLNATVAIKILRPAGTGWVELSRRFAQEVSAAARNRHPNVVQVLHSDTVFDVDVPRFSFLVTEFLSGGTLQEWLRRNPRKSAECPQLRSGVRKLQQLCSGLQSLHAHGIVHRDIKPENIMLDQFGNPKLGDFGLCSIFSCEAQPSIAAEHVRFGSADPETSRLTHDGELLGTPCYMSPEVLLSSQQASPASDQYAVGVILYELICGIRPRQRMRKDPDETLRIREDVELLMQGKQPLPIAPPSTRGGVRCPGLQRICLRCLRTDPADRYPSIAELATDLERWLEGEQTGGGPLSEFWNAWIYRPVKQQPFRHLLAVGGALTTILLIMTAADALERTAEAERRAVALNEIVEERNRRNQELTQTLAQLRTQLQLFLETLRSLTELTLQQDFVSSPATLELRNRVLQRVGNDCCLALQSASTNVEKQVLLEGGLSELVRILLRTGELEQARRVGELLLQVSEECLTSFADFASPAVTEHLSILLLLTDLELEAQNIAAADQYLQTLRIQLPQSSNDSEVLHWQAEVARRMGNRYYLEYSKQHDRVGQQEAVESARRFAEQDLELRRKLLKQQTDPVALVTYCTTLASLSLYCYKGGDSATAIETQNEALSILKTLIEDSTVSEDARQQFVRICFNGVMPLRAVGQVQQALDLAELGLQQARKLVELHPLVLRHQQELARGYGNQAETLLVIYLKNNDPVLLPDILKNLQTSAELFRAVHQRDPGRSRARDDAAIQLLRQIVIQCLLNQPELARRAFLQATMLADMHPRKTLTEMEPGNGLNALGERLGTTLADLDQFPAETPQTTAEQPSRPVLKGTDAPEMNRLLGNFPQLRQDLAEFLNP